MNDVLLPKLTKNDVAMQLCIQNLQGAMGARLADGVQLALQTMLNTSVRVYAPACTTTHTDWVTAVDPHQRAAISFVCGPMGEKGMCLIDTVLVKYVMGLLFGTSIPTDANEALSEVEKGFLAFLAAKLLTVYGAQEQTFQGHYLQLLQTLEPVEDPAVMLSSCVVVGDVTGYVQLFLPSIVLHNFAKVPTHPSKHVHAFSRIADVLLPISLTLGEVEFSAEELSQLTVGDVIFLEHHQLHHDGKKLQGRVHGSISQPSVGTLTGDLSCVHFPHYQVVLSTISYQEPSMSFESFDEDATVIKESAPEMELVSTPTPSLLSNVTTTVTIELSRLHMPLKAIVELQVGAVLQLEKTPQDPVDLVVAGKSIGKGELVSVDGELGVRILSLL